MAYATCTKSVQSIFRMQETLAAQPLLTLDLPVGNGEVDSSILSGSTIFPRLTSLREHPSLQELRALLLRQRLLNISFGDWRGHLTRSHFAVAAVAAASYAAGQKLRLLLALIKAPESTKNRYLPTGWVMTKCGR